MSKTLAIALPIFVVGYLITVFSFIVMQDYFPGNYEYLEMVWYFTGINVAMMTVSVFLIVQKSKIRYSKSLASFSSLMFGVYLIHFIVVQAVYDVFIGSSIHPFIQILSIAIISFAISYIIAVPLKKWKLTRSFVS